MQSPFQFSHGGYVKTQAAAESLRFDMRTAARSIDVETDFDYLFPELSRDPNSLLNAADTAKTIAQLKDLGNAMIDAKQPVDPQATNSLIPPVYTYWGQFIDHDITANTDRTAAALETDILQDNFKPLAPDFIIDKLKNLRRPTFDLDSVYGDGPTLDPNFPTAAKDFYQEEDPVKFKIGRNAEQDAAGRPTPGAKIPPEDDLNRDLPRENRIATIGDSRNDENLIVAQFHLAVLRFHNAVVDWVRKNEPENDEDNPTLFNRCQNLVRWHYQWLVINDFLKTLTVAGTVDRILEDGPQFYNLEDRNVFMPLEFSVASYRFGHSMVRAAYDYNRNFTDQPGALTDATFELLFAFTGRGNIGERGGPGANETLPFNWIIEWNRFVSKRQAAQRLRNSARKIDTHLAPPLSTLVNEGEAEGENPTPMPSIRDLLKHLAKRNLLRGYLLSIPTGQSLAKRLCLKVMTSRELQQNNSEAMNKAIAPFLEKTPAWFYILKESEVYAKGDSLGPVGSQIVAETFIGLMMNDQSSYLNKRDYDGCAWNPCDGVKLADGRDITSIGKFLRFAGVMM
jgi:Animal haem peroxidase